MPPRAACGRASPAPITFDDVTFTYPGTKTPALDRVSFSIPAGTMLGVVGRSGSGKSTHHPPAAGHQPRLQRLREDRRHRSARDQPAPSAPELRRGAAGQLPVPRLDPRQHHRRPPGPDAGRRGARRAPRRRRGIHRAHAERLRDLHRGRLAQPLRRAEAAARDRARADQRSAHPDPRRSDQRARSGKRGGGQRQPAAHRARPDHGHRLPPPVVADRMRPDPGAGAGQGSSTSRRIACCSSAARSTASSGRSRTATWKARVPVMPLLPRPSSKAISRAGCRRRRRLPDDRRCRRSWNSSRRRRRSSTRRCRARRAAHHLDDRQHDGWRSCIDGVDHQGRPGGDRAGHRHSTRQRSCCSRWIRRSCARSTCSRASR